MLDKPECPWSPKLAEDAARIGSVTAQAARIRVPWLLVHGDADEMVPCQDALDAREAAGGRPELVRLPGIDHRFNGALPQVIDAVVPWLRARMYACSLKACATAAPVRAHAGTAAVTAARWANPAWSPSSRA